LFTLQTFNNWRLLTKQSINQTFPALSPSDLYKTITVPLPHHPSLYRIQNHTNQSVTPSPSHSSSSSPSSFTSTSISFPALLATSPSYRAGHSTPLATPCSHSHSPPKQAAHSSVSSYEKRLFPAVGDSKGDVSQDALGELLTIRSSYSWFGVEGDDEFDELEESDSGDG
jgi:hypothetical protein